jgi:outer membrane protein assembly factor BamA
VRLWSTFILLAGLSWPALCQQDTTLAARPPADSSVDTQVLRVNRILVIGNKVTRERIILRELSLQPGDTVSAGNVEDILIRDRSKIYNLRLFQTVVVRTIPADPNLIDILVEVSERWYTFPQPIFELSDRNFNDWWVNYGHDFKRINYGLRLYRNNFRGLNEYIRFTAQFGYSRRFGLLYRVPNLGRSQKHGLSFMADYGEPKNLATKTVEHVPLFLETRSTLKKSLSLATTYSYRRSFYVTHSVTLEHNNSTAADTVLGENANYFAESGTQQSYTALSYQFNSDHRDVIAYPLKGFHFSGYISKTGLIPTDDVNMLELNALFAQHYSLGDGLFLSNFTSGYFSSPKQQPYSMYNALGYRRQFIRGYETYLVEGPQFVLNKTTLKYRIFSRAWSIEDSPLEQFRHFPVSVYLKVYYDFGYVENYPQYEQAGVSTPLANRYLQGTGVGLDVVTLYDNVFRFEYTFSKNGRTGFFFNVRKEF